MTWLPTYENVLSIHGELVSLFAEEDDPISPPGLKDENLLRSACDRPNTALGITEKYSTTASKCAALFHSLTKNHPFHNGNKRTALVTLLTTLHRNDLRLIDGVSDDQVYDLVVRVTADVFPDDTRHRTPDEAVVAIEHWIRDSTEPSSHRIGSMRLNEFVKKCEQAGARAKEVKGGAIAINNGKKNIRISKSTQQMDGRVVAAYLKRLGLSATASGIDITEFQSGANPEEKQQIYRFMAALRRLAKT